LTLLVVVSDMEAGKRCDPYREGISRNYQSLFRRNGNGGETVP